ncbi:Cob(I)yrinic acid a,c-diamide adenosyltransferase [Candidatus Johnevansia muelleri]|uniref:Corrinoid adenosyltransferase n=1 Tax=Candidatus Johnevansia muelleri TaxID=1495769 RepID=A0A078KEF0_9GAMM|nr:Cob(I)yrinic acid a,c-diamide adenosyltransferase [Candidatus Evansia muelleri]
MTNILLQIIIIQKYINKINFDKIYINNNNIIKKKYINLRISKAKKNNGVFILIKGYGKGKSSSALGTVVRTLGHNYKIAVIQFVKGYKITGEYLFFKNHPFIDIYIMGYGFTWETNNKIQDLKASQTAWKLAESKLSNTYYKLLIFDEISYPINNCYIDIKRVAYKILTRSYLQNVIVTGRMIPVELQYIADTISTINNNKHALGLYIKSQDGIEY